MEFTWFFTYMEGQPFWWAALICPAILVAAGFLLAVLRAKKAFLPLAVALGGAQTFLVCCFFPEGDSVQPDTHLLFVVAWAGIYLVLCVLVRLLFLIPFRRKNRANREEEIYRKFHVALEMPDEAPEGAAENVCVGAGEGVRLQHVLSLLEKLRACNLSASDRLETDAIARTLDVFQGKDMTADDLLIVNDSLASVLKMTAKYKL